MGDKVKAGESVNVIQFSTDFEEKMKRGEEGIDLESVKIGSKDEVLQLKVIIPGNSDDSVYWDFVSYFLESNGINASGEAKPSKKGGRAEPSTEIFYRIYLTVENRTPIIKAEFKTEFGKLTRLKIQREKNTNKLLLESDGTESETVVSLKLEKTGLYLESEQGTQVNVIPDIITYIKNIQLIRISEKSIFEITGEKEGKLLGLKPITVNIEADINSDTFEIESVKKPWWSFLVW